MAASLLSRLRPLGRVVACPTAPSRPCGELLRRLSAAPAGVSSISQPQQDQPEEEKNMSKAMISYMKRASQHEEFMKKQEAEFAIGKRHLANMMGENSENFTQEDVDRAIEYLFPTGIFDRKARPHMRPPSEVFPQQKKAQFDYTGRPHHSLFYTLQPNLYQTLHDLTEKMNQLYRLENKNKSLGQKPDPKQKLVLLGSEWIGHLELNKLLVETLNKHQYEEFVRAMSRLVEHPLAYHHRDFIFKFRVERNVTSSTDNVPELLFDADGRPYVDAVGYRKKTVAQVRVVGRGSGDVTINGMPLVQYFWRSLARSGDQEVAQVMFPLQVAGLLHSVDVTATVTYSGPEQKDRYFRPMLVQAPSSQAGAVRHGISLALLSFVDSDMRDTMRIAGLLQRDVRERERYKPGRKGSRRGRTWKKR